MAQSCFRQGCELEAQYLCLCLGSQTYSCEFHLQMHLKLPNRTHNFDSLFIEPSEGTKSTILEFLSKQKSKKEKLKKIALAEINKNCYNQRESIDKNLRRLDSDLKEISSLIEKFSGLSEESSPLNSFILENDEDAKRDKAIFSKDFEPYRSANLFCKLDQLRKKKFEILNRANNDQKIEDEFRRICSSYGKYASDSLFSQDYQEYVNAYQKATSTYLIEKEKNNFNLFIYDTESEKEEIKVLEIPPGSQINFIVQLPNNELFLINSTAYIVNSNYQIQTLPYIIIGHCYACIYFNKSVYYFEGFLEYDEHSDYSDDYFDDYSYMDVGRFDLCEHRWIWLASVKHEYIYDDGFGSVTFNGNILISEIGCNLLMYSIEINSFSKIPYVFSTSIKILINGGERLYIIECDNRWIYESEIGDEYAWNKIKRLIIDFDLLQVYCSYNKGGIYISAFASDERCRIYYKFDLSQKSLIEIACYGESLALKRIDGEVEVIECYGKDFELNSVSPYIQKRTSISHLVKNIEIIEHCNNAKSQWNDKAAALRALGRQFEALECYNELIKLEPKNVEYLSNKAYTLYDLGRYFEAIECYSDLIELRPKYKNYYIYKADSLYELERYHEAIECYNKLIKIKPKSKYFHIRKADTLHRLGKNHKASKYFKKAFKLKSDNPLYFCYLANMLNNRGETVEAIQEFNKAYDLFLKRTNNDCDYFYFDRVEDYLELLKMICKLLESDVEFKEKIEKIKGLNIKNLEILYEIEEKEKVIKEKHSQLLKRAIKCIDRRRTDFIEEIEKMKIEIAENQKEIIDEVTELSLLISAQDSQEIMKLKF